jgi:hypothetical protein
LAIFGLFVSFAAHFQSPFHIRSSTRKHETGLLSWNFVFTSAKRFHVITSQKLTHKFVNPKLQSRTLTQLVLMDELQSPQAQWGKWYKSVCQTWVQGMSEQKH